MGSKKELSWNFLKGHRLNWYNCSDSSLSYHLSRQGSKRQDQKSFTRLEITFHFYCSRKIPTQSITILFRYNGEWRNNYRHLTEIYTNEIGKERKSFKGIYFKIFKWMNNNRKCFFTRSCLVGLFYYFICLI